MHSLCRRLFLFTSISITCLAFGMLPHVLAADTPLKPNERILFLGDAITQNGEAPNGFLSLMKGELAKTEKFNKVTIIGAGVKGDKVPDLESRLEKDVISIKPSVVVVFIGANDVWHPKSGMGTKKDIYEDGLRRIVRRITAGGARVILCTPATLGEKVDGTNPLDEMLEVYCEINRKVAADTKSQLLDLRKAFIEYLKKKNLQNEEKGILTTDGVHLNELGNRFVGLKMMEAIGALGTPSK